MYVPCLGELHHILAFAVGFVWPLALPSAAHQGLSHVRHLDTEIEIDIEIACSS